MTRLANRPVVDLSTQRYIRRFGAAEDQASLLMSTTALAPRPRWTGLIETLKAWRDRPKPDTETNSDACRRAVVYAQLLASDNERLPTRVGPTPNGGIAFEWEDGGAVVHIEILDGRNAEFTEFRGTHLVGDAELIWNEDDQVYHAVDS